MKHNSDILRIRQLIWLYFWLLLFEGALRKWIIPSLANPLLIVRDPIVLVIYFLAWRSGCFPRNIFIFFTGLLAILTVTASLFAENGNLAVTIYGARTDFLQIPLIFLIPKAFDSRDVDKIGFYILLLSIPMAFLMVMQFRSSPSAWINSGIEGNFGQIDSAGGHIRPPGLFSFILGPSSFYSLNAAFLLNSQFKKTSYPIWLILFSLLSIAIATAVSGSRTLLSSSLIVCVFSLVYPIAKLRLKFKWLYTASILFVIGFIIAKLPVFQEGVSIFSERVQNAGRVEGGNSGFASRFLSDFSGFVPFLYKAPPLGEGLGVGTTAGAALLTGKPQFLLSEAEWGRIIMESGPSLGLGFILYRVVFAIFLGYMALKQIPLHNPLPLLLFAACFINILVGQIGQPTLLGFVIFISGLCLAAMRSPHGGNLTRFIRSPRPYRRAVGSSLQEVRN